MAATRQPAGLRSSLKVPTPGEARRTAPAPNGASAAPLVERPVSKNEVFKRVSDGLAGTLAAEFANEEAVSISNDAAQLLKFHGSYQQDNRDQRATSRKEGG